MYPNCISHRLQSPSVTFSWITLLSVGPGNPDLVVYPPDMFGVADKHVLVDKLGPVPALLPGTPDDRQRSLQFFVNPRAPPGSAEVSLHCCGAVPKRFTSLWGSDLNIWKFFCTRVKFRTTWVYFATLQCTWILLDQTGSVNVFFESSSVVIKLFKGAT